MDPLVTLTLELTDEQAWQLSIMCKRLLAEDAGRLEGLCGARRGAREELGAAVNELAKLLHARGYAPG